MFLFIDKPKGITSHDAVNRIRRITGLKRVGHAGTLDPNATGLLIIALGRESTKNISKIALNNTKKYSAEIILGEERTTDDLEGDILTQADASQIGINDIKNVISSFIGTQLQIPPQYSAIKIKGRKAYELARKGMRVKLKTRKITIYSIKLKYFKNPVLKLDTEVSSGTYIRALARDIGRKLGCGAYLRELRRLKIGTYDIKQAVELDALAQDNWKSYAVNLF